MDSCSERFCPVCGDKVVGRSDKKFCCDECRSYANNLKQREQKKNTRKIASIDCIEKALATLGSNGDNRYLKIIAAVSLFCKIIYKFGHQNKEI